MEWAIEVCKETGLPVAASMCIGPEGDLHGNSNAECAVRMAKAGANVVGVNCHFDPMMSLDALKLMKAGLEEAGLLDSVHLMCQPLAYKTPDAGRQGFIDLPEFPFGLEPRICTRWDMHKFARDAWELGVRYIGGCCGFQPYHIRALSEELLVERGGNKSEGMVKHMPWGGGLTMHTKPWVRARARRDYWEHMKPASGRPYCPALSQPDNWGVTKGDEILIQQTEATSVEQIKQMQKIQMEKKGLVA